MSAAITYRTAIGEDWVDYNGHLRDAYYLLIFSYATDALMERIGLDADSRGQSGHSLFTLEAHVNYLHEVKRGTEVWVHTQIVDFDTKRLVAYHTLHSDGSDGVLAASEQLLLHVDLAGPKATPFAEHSVRQLQQMSDEQTQAPIPRWQARAIQLRRLAPSDA